MQAHWKRYDRVERETRRRLEKEAEEQRKMDVEFMEVCHQYILEYSVYVDNESYLIFSYFCLSG